MSSPNIYQTGIGGSSGGDFVALSPLYTSGDIWYVSSTTGSDAASPRGKERIRPLATLSQAYTNAAAGDLIVFLSGHTETLTASQTLGKAGLMLMSEGTGSSRAKFTFNAAATAQMFNVTAAGVRLDNLYFVQSTQAPTTARVNITAARFHIYNCYFECGTADTVEAVQVGANAHNGHIKSTTFVSTSTSVSSQPESAIAVAAAVTDLVMEDVVFNGGSSGWSNPYAFDGASAVTRLTATNVDLLNDSDIILATGSVYTIHVRNKSGSARVVLAA